MQFGLMIGPLLFLLWGIVLLASLVAVVVHVLRHRTRNLAWACLCPVGAALMFGLVSAILGLVDSVWTLTSPGLWLAVLVGVVGVLLSIIGGRAVLRTPLRSGHCVGCGYPIGGLPVCPECGRKHGSPSSDLA